jgi:hypothetical protein
MRGRRRFRDLLAVSASELFAHVAQNFPCRRYKFERFRRDLANFAKTAAATVGAGARRYVNNPFARQFSVKRTAGGFGRSLFGGRFGALDSIGGFAFAHRRDQFVELHFELIDEPRALFRTCPVLAALHLGNRQLQMGDLRVEPGSTCFGFVSPCFGRNEKRRQCGDIFRKRGRIENHAAYLHCFALSRDRRPVRFLWGTPVDPFEQIPKLRR